MSQSKQHNQARHVERPGDQDAIRRGIEYGLITDDLRWTIERYTAAGLPLPADVVNYLETADPFQQPSLHGTAIVAPQPHAKPQSTVSVLPVAIMRSEQQGSTEMFETPDPIIRESQREWAISQMLGQAGVGAPQNVDQSGITDAWLRQTLQEPSKVAEHDAEEELMNDPTSLSYRTARLVRANERNIAMITSSVATPPVPLSRRRSQSTARSAHPTDMATVEISVARLGGLGIEREADN